MPGQTRKSNRTQNSQKKSVVKEVIEDTESEFEEEKENDLEHKIEKAMQKVMSKFKISFKKEFHDQLRDIENSLNFNSDKIDDFLAEMGSIREKQKKLEDENEALKMKVKSMTIAMEDLDQYSRNKNIQIDGVPEEKGENLRELVMDIGKKVDVDLDAKEIDVIHRIPSKNEKNTRSSPIVVQFTTRQLREKILAGVRKSKITTKDLKKTGEERIVYVNEHLTRAKKQIMFEGRKLKFEKGYKFLWSRNGKIMIRKDEQSKVIELQNLEDLRKII